VHGVVKLFLPPTTEEVNAIVSKITQKCMDGFG